MATITFQYHIDMVYMGVADRILKRTKEGEDQSSDEPLRLKSQRRKKMPRNKRKICQRMLQRMLDFQLKNL